MPRNKRALNIPNAKATVVIRSGGSSRVSQSRWHGVRPDRHIHQLRSGCPPRIVHGWILWCLDELDLRNQFLPTMEDNVSL
jgi:hypothetical protein